MCLSSERVLLPCCVLLQVVPTAEVTPPQTNGWKVTVAGILLVLLVASSVQLSLVANITKLPKVRPHTPVALLRGSSRATAPAAEAAQHAGSQKARGRASSSTGSQSQACSRPFSACLGLQGSVAGNAYLTIWLCIGVSLAGNLGVLCKP